MARPNPHWLRMVHFMTSLFKQYMIPYWTGNRIYNETLMFMADANGQVGDAPLLYQPDAILSVFSFDLTKEYVEGKDFEKTETGIRLLPGSDIYVWAYSIPPLRD